ncbi:hypothetical protein UFOVP54_216 [uncultured Caudovirales phage]|uniref:Uncharacterized protein n=1 Tax=uncultured Caudovirales phage TaxID=2100421 RepID=A0A6J5KXS0_9CAUD|nr:hypothetical protein UFOVP54_216 [uncultured Caudovirales phage]
MTLKERFKQWLDTDPRLQIREVQLEVIAEDFAIGFAEWLRNKTAQIKGDRYKLFSDFEIYTIKELLEIYKKEKGL